MNYIDTVEQALKKRDTMLANKFSELELLEVKKEQIDEELRESEKEYFKLADDLDRVESYEEKKIEKENIVKKIAEVNNQIRLLEATFYIDYDIEDIEKELKSEINSTGVLKDLEKVDKKINELKELATEIEAKKNNISLKVSEYMQHIMYLPREKQDFFKKKIQEIQEKELTLKIANSDITAFLDHVGAYYRKHEKIFK
jgi:DNA repair exonuclease SbcCD ATPase subunit